MKIMESQLTYYNMPRQHLALQMLPSLQGDHGQSDSCPVLWGFRGTKNSTLISCGSFPSIPDSWGEGVPAGVSPAGLGEGRCPQQSWGEGAPLYGTGLSWERREEKEGEEGITYPQSTAIL